MARRLRFLLLLGLCSLLACRHTLPGTHVELIDEEGKKAYVSGAAAPGMNHGIACGAAVNRAVAAIALRFSQEQDDIADDVGKAVGSADGAAFLQQYAKAAAQVAAVQDVQFDPGQHLCMATVRWTPPMLVKDAVVKFSVGLRQQELHPAAASAPAAAPPAPAPGPAPLPLPPPPAANSVAPPPAAAAPVRPACGPEKKALAGTRKGQETVLADYSECLQRTENDANVCYRYGLYVEEAKKKAATAGAALAACVSQDLPLQWRSALGSALPGHAGKFMENRADGAAILWTVSPVDQSAYVLELAPDGHEVSRAPLPANQIMWLRDALGL